MSTNKIALVTGGSRGIGRNIALKIAEKGLDVILTYHSKKVAAEEIVMQIEKLGQKAVAFQLDTSDTS
ncbi:MAG: SDR family NAD(P)-dependent oxidoreductase, partial [Maribacter stanieri]